MKWLLLVPLLLAACAPASDVQPGALYYELTIGSFTAVHAYGAFSSYDAAVARVKWLKESGYMLEGAPYFIQPRRLDEPLVVIDAGGPR